MGEGEGESCWTNPLTINCFGLRHYKVVSFRFIKSPIEAVIVYFALIAQRSVEDHYIEPQDKLIFCELNY